MYLSEFRKRIGIVSFFFMFSFSYVLMGSFGFACEEMFSKKNFVFHELASKAGFELQIRDENTQKLLRKFYLSQALKQEIEKALKEGKVSWLEIEQALQIQEKWNGIVIDYVPDHSLVGIRYQPIFGLELSKNDPNALLALIAYAKKKNISLAILDHLLLIKKQFDGAEKHSDEKEKKTKIGIWVKWYLRILKIHQSVHHREMSFKEKLEAIEVLKEAAHIFYRFKNSAFSMKKVLDLYQIFYQGNTQNLSIVSRVMDMIFLNADTPVNPNRVGDHAFLEHFFPPKPYIDASIRYFLQLKKDKPEFFNKVSVPQGWPLLDDVMIYIYHVGAGLDAEAWFDVE